jgi:hypothetical protein
MDRSENEIFEVPCWLTIISYLVLCAIIGFNLFK